MCVLPKLGQVRETKFGTNVSNRMLQNAKVTVFTISELLRENQHEGGERGKITTTQIWVKKHLSSLL